VILDACGEIMRRLRYIQKVLESSALASETSGRSPDTSVHRASKAYFHVSTDRHLTKGVLGVRDETDTIGNLLTRVVHELTPDISYAGYTCVPHEKIMKLTVCHAVSDPEDIGPILSRAVKHAYAIFRKIQEDIRKLP
jgi:DNA-directed RNA polymerase subunit L